MQGVWTPSREKRQLNRDNLEKKIVPHVEVKTDVNGVRNYIARQKEHHQQKSSRDEFLDALKKNGVEYDEQYPA